MVDETSAADIPQVNSAGEETAPPAKELLVQNIPPCCIATIVEHVRFNPMMVCAECKNIVKCFHDERAFQNYLTFCRSRRRAVLTGVVQDLWTVAFRSYDTFSR